jgi:transposase-like protein
MGRVTQDDVLFGYRLQVFELAGRTSVAEAGRTFGIHRWTYYAWRDQVERGGLEMLRPRERRRRQMPNQLAAMVEERIVAFSLAHPGLGPKKVAAELARPKWGGLVVSPERRLQGAAAARAQYRQKRLSLIAG